MTQEHPSLPVRQVIAPPRPPHATDRYDGPTELYRLYDAEDRLLYIGVTCNKAARWEAHRTRSPWWKLVARKELTTYPDRSAALTAERDAILAERPTYNIAGHPQRLSRHLRLTLTEERAQKLRALAQDRGLPVDEMVDDLIDEAQPYSEHPAVEPSDLDVAIRVAQQLLDSDQILSVREALRLLLRALGAEPETELPPAEQHTPVGPGCGAPASARIEGYSPRDGLAHGSLDLAVYACDEHAAQARDEWLDGLMPYTTRYVVDARCGERFDFTTLRGGR